VTIIFRLWLFKKGAPNKIDSLRNISKWDCKRNLFLQNSTKFKCCVTYAMLCDL